MKTVTLNQFDGPMTNDPRDTAGNVARISKHVDNDTRPHLLTPHPDNDFAGTDPNSAANFDSFRIQKFLYANSTFYGLGVEDGTTKPKIFQKTLIGDAWAASSGGTHASGAALGTNHPVFCLYQNYLWYLDGTVGSRSWSKYGDVTSSTSVTRNIHSNENVVSPIVHSKDDIMYFGYGAGTATQNKIGKNNSGSFTDSVLTFPVGHVVASLAEYGNDIAIGTNTPQGGIVVYFWDRDASLTTLSGKTEMTGTLKFLGNIGGVLVACTTLQPSAALSINPTVVFHYYDGSKFVEFQRYTTSAAVVYGDVQPFNNILYFMAEMTIDSVVLRGIWKIWRRGDGTLAVSFDRLPRLDDTITTLKLYGFMREGDYFHIACANFQDNDKYIVTKTTPTYLTTAIRRTAINPNMDPQDKAARKQLLAVSAEYGPLAAGESFILKYRVDGGAWTTIFTETTVGATRTRRTAISTGARFVAGQEYEFSFEPGGAKLTGLKYQYVTLSQGI